MTPIPAEPPIGGPFWTLVLPALLFAVAFLATFLLYRHFSRDGER
jgi:hypothetical protein